MLTKDSEQFLIELRNYLVYKGKNDDEINEICDELEDHFTTSLEKGKSIEDIIGKSPKEYMESISKEMKTDVKQSIVTGIFGLLTVLSYFSIGSAIKGNFSLSLHQLVFGGTLLVLLGTFSWVFMLRGLPRIIMKDKLAMIAVFAFFILLTGSFVAYKLWIRQIDSTPFYLASPLVNNLIVLLSVLAVTISSYYLKSKFLLLVLLYIAVDPLVTRLNPFNDIKSNLYLSSGINFALIIVFIGYAFIKNKCSAKNA